MIKVARPPGSAPPVLTDIKRAGPRETERAIDFFVRAKGKGPPTFMAYKDPEVKQALELVFRKKCAYCETIFAASGPFPVEHWRPKGRVTLPDGTRLERGYFWLAASWENLFYSCNDCNGQRELLDLPTGIQRLMGKLDRFPLVDEAKRAKGPGDEMNEVPLLLNPCCDDPAEHLEFFDVGEDRAMLRPKADSPKGECSIETFALNRLDLAKARKEVQGRITVLKTMVDVYLKMLDAEPTPTKENLALTGIRVGLVELMRMRGAESQYTALARKEVDEFLTPLLQRFGLPPLT